MNFFKKIFIIILFIFSFQKSFALIISEIQFDPDGSDTDREWIEIFNNTDQSIVLSNYKVTENNKDNKISNIDYSEVLPNEYAVLVQSKEKFLIDFPSFSGKVFLADFSLLNTGEKVSIKNPSLNIVDEVLYNPNQTGSGAGKTEQKDFAKNVWGAGSSTPGFENKIEENENATTTTENPNTYKINYYTKSSWPTSEKVYIKSGENTISLPEKIIKFQGSILDADKKSINCDSYFWSFGDGNISNLKEPIHKYIFEGEYTAVLECSLKNSIVKDYFFIKVIKPDIKIFAEKNASNTLIEIKNNTAEIIDLSDLYIKDEDKQKTFILPKNFTILPDRSIKLSNDITGFSNISNNFSLYLSSGKKIDSFTFDLNLENKATTTLNFSVMEKSEYDKKQKETENTKLLESKKVVENVFKNQNFSQKALLKKEILSENITATSSINLSENTKTILSRPKETFFQRIKNLLLDL